MVPVETDFVDQKSPKTPKPKLVSTWGRLSRKKPLTEADALRGSEIRGSEYH